MKFSETPPTKLIHTHFKDTLQNIQCGIYERLKKQKANKRRRKKENLSFPKQQS